MCVHSSICLTYNRYKHIGMYTHACMYHHIHRFNSFAPIATVELGLRGSSDRSLWPNYHILIKINPNGSSKYTKRAVCKWLLFTFPHSFSFKINTFLFLCTPTTLSESPTYHLKILKSFPFRGPSRRKKKNNKAPDGKYKPSAGVMHKIPDTFFS